MVSMKSNQKQFWIRRIDTTQNIASYSDSEIIFLNLFPTNADVDLIALGAEYKEYMRARISHREIDTYSIGDLIYDTEPVYSSRVDIGNAAYKITAILATINVAEIQCKRLSGSE